MQNNKAWFILACMISLFLLSQNNVEAESSTCSKTGYTVLTINGIFTDDISARKNKEDLKKILPKILNSEPVTVDYLYNATHISGVRDIFDAIRQGLFDDKYEGQDYDLIEMLDDASEKVKTEKILLVAHSQGNFYANNFYNKVVDKKGGVPASSMGVYSVATPDDYVAGDGKHLTSDTDEVIAGIVGRVLSRPIMVPNIHIELKDGDDDTGHSFSDVYLKYRGDRIVSDIKSSLSKLKVGETEDGIVRCIDPQQVSFFHEVEGVALAMLDKSVGGAVKILVKSTKTIASVTNIFLSNWMNMLSSAILSTDNELVNNLEENNFNIDTIVENNNKSDLVLLPTKNVSVVQEKINIIENKSKETVVKIVEVEPIKLAKNNLSSSGHHSPSNRAENPVVEEVPVTEEDPAEEIPAEEGIVDEPEDLPEEDPVIEEEPEDQTEEEEEIPAGEDPIIESDPEEDIDPETPAEDEDPVDPPAEEEEEEDIPAEETFPDEEYVYAFSDLNENTILDSEEDEVIVTSKLLFLSAGNYRFKNLIIKDGAILTLKGNQNYLDSYKGVRIIADNITVENNAQISANGGGYLSNEGPGISDVIYAGASYGGLGHGNIDKSTIYGSEFEPMDLGSGGGYTGGDLYYSGGGAIRLMVKEVFLNEGVISSDGKNSASGGSIYITTKDISGSGIIRADGGAIFANNYYKYPGGGGRVAVYFETSSFDGEVEALGGWGTPSGSMVYGGDGTAGMFDTSNDDFYIKKSWNFQNEYSPFSFNKIYMTGGAKVTSDDDVEINADELYLDNTSIFTLSENQILNIPVITIEGESTLLLSGSESINTDELNLIGAKSIITVAPEQILNLEISTINILDGASIDANIKGYIKGPGYPKLENGGASYGGFGAGGNISSLYGSETEPIDFGSSGDGYSPRGGGAIRIISDNIVNDGGILANGNNTSSGGSIYITVGEISGVGSITTNGGGSYCPNVCFGPGGGGRIAIYYDIYSFTGEVKSVGWSGYGGSSQNGTVKLIDGSIVPDTTPPAIKSFLINESTGDVTSDGILPVKIFVEAEENVNWVSIDIQNVDDSNLHKIFYSSILTCNNGTSTCTKDWENGKLTKAGTTLVSGTYRVKVKMEDIQAEGATPNTFEGYLPSVIIINMAPVVDPPQVPLVEEIVEEVVVEDPVI